MVGSGKTAEDRSLCAPPPARCRADFLNLDKKNRYVKFIL